MDSGDNKKEATISFKQEILGKGEALFLHGKSCPIYLVLTVLLEMIIYDLIFQNADQILEAVHSPGNHRVLLSRSVLLSLLLMLKYFLLSW